MQIAERLTGELYVAVPGAECYAFIPPSIPGLGVTSGVSVEVRTSEGAHGLPDGKTPGG